MSSKRMLVTGGAGFIGSHVVEAGLEAGWSVAVVDDLSTGLRENVPAGVHLYQVDIRNESALKHVFEDFRPNIVSHQAAQASVGKSIADPLLDAEVNIMGGLNVLTLARDYVVERIVFASTGGAIYGEVDNGAAAESTPSYPSSPYAASKLSFEYYLEVFRQQYGIDFVSLRYANVYGPRQNPHGEAGVVAIFINCLASDSPLRINAQVSLGDDGCVRDYVYVGDVARANIMAALGETPRVLNIGTGVATTTRQLAENLAMQSNRTAALEFAPPRAGDLKRSVLNPEKFIEILGKPIDLEEGLRNTVRWRQINDIF